MARSIRSAGHGCAGGCRRCEGRATGGVCGEKAGHTGVSLSFSVSIALSCTRSLSPFSSISLSRARARPRALSLSLRPCLSVSPSLPLYLALSLREWEGHTPERLPPRGAAQPPVSVCPDVQSPPAGTGAVVERKNTRLFGLTRDQALPLS